MAYYAQQTAGAYPTTTASPYGSPPPIAGAVYPPGSMPYGTTASSTHTSPTLPGQPPGAGGPLSPYAQTAFPYGGGSPQQQQRVSPGSGYAPLATPGAAGVGVGTAAPYTAPPGQSIQPGSVTYTTTTDTNGRVTYHQFRAEPATHTANGITYTGIQWVPTETTYNLPVGATPAGPEFVASWQGGQITPDQERALREWQREEDKRRRKEEKETAKRVASWEKESKARERAEDKALRAAREADSRTGHDVRRFQDRGGGHAPVFPGGYSNRERERERDRDSDRDYGHGRERERDRDRAYFPGGGDLDRQFADMNVGGRPSSTYGAPPLGPPAGHTRSRRPSMNMPVPTGVHGRAGSDTYDDDGDSYEERDNRSLYANDRHDGGGRYPAPGVVPGVRSRANSMVGSATSPYHRGAQLPPAMGPDGLSVYPSGHVLEGQPLGANSRMGTLSRSHSPAPLGGNNPPPGGFFPSGSGFIPPGGSLSPRMPNASLAGGLEQPIAVPEAFSRPINRAVTFTPFELTKVQDMDDFLEGPPRMPPVLQTHDVVRDEWARLMNDLSLAWLGKLPLPGGARQPKKSALVMDLLDLWNAQFFVARGAELVLYKGRERKTGRGAGRPEMRLPRLDDYDSEDDTESTEDSESEAEYAGHGGSRMSQYGTYGGYGREQDAEKRYRKEEKKRRARERKQRKKEMAKKYTLYMAYVPQREFSSTGQPLH